MQAVLSLSLYAWHGQVQRIAHAGSCRTFFTGLKQGCSRSGRSVEPLASPCYVPVYARHNTDMSCTSRLLQDTLLWAEAGVQQGCICSQACSKHLHSGRHGLRWHTGQQKAGAQAQGLLCSGTLLQMICSEKCSIRSARQLLVC